ncbi:MAG: 2-dehydropantoate 2-reductase [Ktedonobacterales bacterium]
MRIVVIGAGAIGCYLAARLSDAGEQVTLVGRPDQVAAISANGLLVRDSRDEAQSPAQGVAKAARRYQLPAVTRLEDIAGTAPETDQEDHLVLLAVKTQDVPNACQVLREWREQGHIALETPILTLQNGVRADALAAQELGEAAIVGGVVMCAVTFTQPGEISVQFPGWLIVGEPFGPVGKRTQAIVNTLNAAIPTFLTHDLRAVRWSKLITNLNNGICAATGLTMPQVARDPAGALIAARMMQEGQRVAKAAGVRLDHGLYGLSLRALRRDSNAALVALLQSLMNGAMARMPAGLAARLLALAGRSRLGNLPIRGSTWQSLARGKASEIAYLNGEIVRQGNELGVTTPYNTRLVALVKQVERTGTFFPLAALEPSRDGHTASDREDDLPGASPEARLQQRPASAGEERATASGAALGRGPMAAHPDAIAHPDKEQSPT